MNNYFSGRIKLTEKETDIVSQAYSEGLILLVTYKHQDVRERVRISTNFFHTSPYTVARVDGNQFISVEEMVEKVISILEEYY